MSSTVDPITVEVFNHALNAIGEEMAATMRHTARSHMARGGDCSTILADARGEVIAQGTGTLFHMGYAKAVMPFVLAKWDGRLEPGDIVAVNDPYQGLSHLPDILLVAPVFWAGRVAAYAMILAHQMDIGGRWPGGQGIESAEIFEEGLIIPNLKLYHQGAADRGLMDMIAANVRTPDDVIGDVEGLASACRRGVAGVEALLERYGLETFEACTEDLKNRSARIMGLALAAIPDGDYPSETLFEDDGLGGSGVVLRLTLRKRGDALTVDFAGTDPQVRSAVNVPWGLTCSAVYAACWFLLAPEAPCNAGLVRTIKVEAPLGSLVNPRFPAAVGARGMMLWRITDLLIAAIGKAAPEQAMADGEGGVSSFTFVPRGGKLKMMLDYYFGGWGARPTKDGVDGAMAFAGGIGGGGGSTERLEAEFPIVIEQHGFVPDTGGAGKFRGALAMVRRFRVLQDGRVMMRCCRSTSVPQGLSGGQDGTPTRVVHRSAGVDRELPVTMLLDFDAVAGDTITHIVPGAAGHGNPRERPADLVLADVLDGKLSPAYAERVCGVVVDLAGGRVDQARTSALRGG